MHPNAHLADSRQAPDFFKLLAPTGAVEPCINAMQTDFAACSQELVDANRDIPGVVPGGPKTRGWAGRALSRPIPKGNYEESRGDIVFQFKVSPVEFTPEIPGRSEIDEWQLQHGCPVRKQRLP